MVVHSAPCEFYALAFGAGGIIVYEGRLCDRCDAAVADRALYHSAVNHDCVAVPSLAALMNNEVLYGLVDVHSAFEQRVLRSFVLHDGVCYVGLNASFPLCLFPALLKGTQEVLVCDNAPKISAFGEQRLSLFRLAGFASSDPCLDSFLIGHNDEVSTAPVSAGYCRRRSELSPAFGWSPYCRVNGSGMKQGGAVAALPCKKRPPDRSRTPSWCVALSAGRL